MFNQNNISSQEMRTLQTMRSLCDDVDALRAVLPQSAWETLRKNWMLLIKLNNPSLLREFGDLTDIIERRANILEKITEILQDVNSSLDEGTLSNINNLLNFIQNNPEACPRLNNR